MSRPSNAANSLKFALLACGLLSASLGSGGVAAESPRPAGLPKTVATSTIGLWEASIIRFADGSLQGVAHVGGGSVVVGGDRLGVFLACLDDAWSIGFTGSYGTQWEEFVASVERGGFVDEGVDIPPEEVPFVLYKVGGGLPGRADWRLGSVEARAAATVVLWIGMTKVNFQVSLDVTESERLLAGTPLGGDLSVTLTDGKEPWLLTEMPPFADVTAFFLEHDCGKQPD